MNKLVLLKNVSKQSTIAASKIRRNAKFIDGLKFLTTFFVLIFVLGVYGYFVNVSSTKGYFWRNELKKLEEVKFNNSIVQIEVLKKEKKLWDSVQQKFVYSEGRTLISEKYIQVEDSSTLAMK